MSLKAAFQTQNVTILQLVAVQPQCLGDVERVVTVQPANFGLKRNIDLSQNLA